MSTVAGSITRTITYPSPEGMRSFPQFCTHPLEEDETHECGGSGFFSGVEHLLVVAWGGRPGCVAAVMGEDGWDIGWLTAWVEAARADGFNRISIEGCGYGERCPICDPTSVGGRREQA